MAISVLFIVNRAGSLIFDQDFSTSRVEYESTFSFPLNFVFKEEANSLIVHYGTKDGNIKVGQALVGINGDAIKGTKFANGDSITEYFQNPKHFPVNLKFSKVKPSVNERIMLSSMFNTIYHMASQLSPEEKSKGIQELETRDFTLHCLQTLTGLKFLILAEPKTLGIDLLLRKIYELYADYALKNPFYNIEMPIRCELFEKNLRILIDQTEKSISGNF